MNLNIQDETNRFSEQDINQNKGIACISYLSILFIIPLLVKPESPFVKFHVNQGLNLFIISVIFSIMKIIVSFFFSRVFFIGQILNMIISILTLALMAITIVFIVFTVQGKAKRLPIIGNIEIIK